jgi:hypothetical protein
MYARVSTFEAPIEKLEAGIQVWRDEMQPWMREASGFRGWVALLDRANARAIGISFWATEEAMRDAEASGVALRDAVATSVETGLTTTEFFEVAAVDGLELGAPAEELSAG